MKKLIYPALIATVITTSAFTVATSNKWTVKEGAYTVKFNSKKGKDVSGIFKGLKSDIQFDEANIAASKISASIDASSVNTGNGMRNKHAKQGLGAEQFSTIKFESTSVTKVGSSYEATGKLTIKDVTKEIKLPFTFTKTADGGVFDGKFSVVPSEYHVEKKNTPELLEIELNVPVTK
jgi:polyisoprenoid-binding protein YceI